MHVLSHVPGQPALDLAQAEFVDLCQVPAECIFGQGFRVAPALSLLGVAPTLSILGIG